jgi:PAS domain S-box-containing protein
MNQNNNSITVSLEEPQTKQVDLATTLKDSLTISEQLALDKLAETLMRMIMQVSEADKGYILIEQNSQMLILTESETQNVTNIKLYNTLQIPDYKILPEKIIQDVIRTQENIIVNDVLTDKIYASYNYIFKTHPKSIACIPIISNKKIVGAVYLENYSLKDVFTDEKVATLQILTAQAVASFTNMILYDELDLTQKRFQDILNNSNAFVFAKYLNGKYLFINKQFEKIRKVKREKVINLTDYEIFSKEFADSYVAKDKIIIETEKPLTYEEKIPHDDGMHTYIVAKFPLRDLTGKFYAIGGIATDISSVRRMEQSLQANQNRFNYVLAATHDAIYDWDLETGRIWRNEQYEKIFDGPTGPNLEWWKHNIHPDEFSSVTAKLETAFSKYDQLWNQEYRFKKITKGYANVIDRGFIIYNEQRKPIRMIGALLDITERVVTEEENKKRTIKIIERQSELLSLNNVISNLPIKEKLKNIIKSDAKTLEVERVSILFFNLDKTSIASENTYLLSKSAYEEGISFTRKEYPRYFSELEYNKIIDSNNADHDPRTSELAETYLKFHDIKSLLNVPIRLKGNVVGVLCHEHLGFNRTWTYEEMVFANSIADVITLTLETDERERAENELKLLNESLEERVKARTAELSFSENQFRAVVETANEAIISADNEDKIIFWNKAAEIIFGYSSKETLGENVSIIMPQKYKERHMKVVYQYLKSKEPHTIEKGFFELIGLKKGGVEFPMELSLETWKSDDKDFFTAIIQDITIRKKNEQELIKKAEETKQTNIFLDTILENIPNIVFVKDAKELRYIRLNKAVEEFMGFKREDLLGKNDYDLFPKEQADFLATNDKKVLNNGGLLDIPEEVITTRNGTRWLHTRIISIKDESGNPLYLVGISLDITEEKRSKKKVN